jgi:pyridoxine 4-dehydrogenase
MAKTTILPAAAAGTFTIGGDLTVNRLGFGAMRITGPGIWGPPANRDDSIAVLKRAVELGVNLIDTANSYGPDVSEELIAEALHPYPADLVIATKGGYRRSGPNQWTPQGDPKSLRIAAEGSLKRLKLDRIAVYQLHAPDPTVPYEESVGALIELQKEGKIQHIGLSNVKIPNIETARTLTPIVSIQNRYSPHDRASDGVIDYCEREQLAFLPWGPIGFGRPLAGQGIEAVASAHGTTTTQISIAWLLARSPVMIPIPGTSSVAHLEENIAAAAITLSAAEREEIAR